MHNRYAHGLLRITIPLGLAALTLGGLAPQAQAASTPASSSSSSSSSPVQSPAMDPRAMKLLAQSADRLKALQTFEVRGESTQDEVIRDGFKVQKQMTETVLVDKPDGMRAQVVGDNGLRMFFYDGNSISLLAGPENYFATVPAPPTLGAMLDKVTSKYDLALPLTDILYMASGNNLGVNILGAGIIGTSRVDGALCDHVAFRTKAADWQVWIERGSLLPRKLVVTTRGAPSAPQYETELAWNLNPTITDQSFAFAPGPDARPMQLATRGHAASNATKAKTNKAKTP